MAVVVLPTPPFWLAMARTRMASGCWGDTVEMADPKNAGVRGGPTRNGLHLHVPLCRRLRQFRLGTSPFEEQANAVGREQRRSQREELRQRCERARGDQWRRR